MRSGNGANPMPARGRRVVLAGLVLGLVALVLLARQTGVDNLFQRVDTPPDTVLTTPQGVPQSQFAVNIDPETNATRVIDITPPPPPPPPRPAPVDTTRVRPEKNEPDRTPDLDLGDLLEKNAGAHAGAGSAQVASIPPRPVEITWPETRQLKQCIGQSVSVKILVSEEGKVEDVQIVPSQILPACADAALAAARHIRFEPGRTGGVPAAMWTEVRIDFQRRD
jgi:TonB family protein